MSKFILALACCSALAACSGKASSPSPGNSAGTGPAASAAAGSNAVASAGTANGGALVNSGGGAPGGAGPNGTSAGGTQPATGGTTAVGGGQPAAGSTMVGASGADSFALSWQDDFNTLDTSNWELENFTFDGNQAQFAPENASVTSGVLTIALTPATGGAKPYLGVEMRSAKTITYGKVSARMRFATGSGVVSGLVLFYTPYPNCDWNEIDIEHLGKSSTTSQFNAMVYVGAQVPNCTTSVSPTQDPLIANLGFDAESDYHLYDVEWTPAGVRYLADGVVLRTWNKNSALLKRPMTVLLTIWASNSASWAGALSATSAPTSAQVDWIKVYDWKG